MTLSSIALIGVPAATADEQQTTAEQNTAAKPSVIINEVYAGNTKAAGDPDSKRCDWAELKNTGSTDVDVKGWGIYDSGKKAKKHYTIGASEVTNTDTVIKAGGYLVAYIDPDKAKPAKTCDAAADMKVSSIKSDNLIVTILATSNCDDKNASTKFNDSATRLTLQDSDDNVVADAVFDFSGLFHVYRAVVRRGGAGLVLRHGLTRIPTIFLRNSSRCTTRSQTYCLSGRVTGPPTAAIPTNTM